MDDMLVDRDGVRFVLPQWPVTFPALRTAVSTRIGGVSREPLGMNTSFRVGDDETHVRENRTRFFRSAGFDGGRLATAGQVHGGGVVEADRPGHYPGCDALVTDRKGLALAVSVADCVPVMLYDPNKQVAGIVHSGWKGSRERITARCVDSMVEGFGSVRGDLHAYIGPSAGGCCYEVGGEVAREFPAGVVLRDGDGRFRLDLSVFNRDLLIASGVPEEQISLSGRCTIHERGIFHSYRRDREHSGRMLALIEISE